MHFNVDRIAILAGLSKGGKSGLMKEGATPAAPTTPPVQAKAPAKPAAPSAPAAKAPAKAAKPEMDERYMEDEGYEEDETYHMDDEGHMEDEGYEEDETRHMDDEGHMEDEGYEEDEAHHMDDEGHMEDETVYEVDETALMEALVDMRERRLNESKLRSAVRDELSDILNTMGGSRWLYGNKAPSNSGKGKVSRGFLGPGFR